MDTKHFIYLFATILPPLGCHLSSTLSDNQRQKQASMRSMNVAHVIHSSAPIKLTNFLTLSEAENILGEPAHLQDSASTVNGDVATYKSAYVANAIDQKTGRTGSVYFLVEYYTLVSSAKDKYSYIKKANETHEGVKALHDLGDEAYFHSDGEHFYFVMARKDKSVFNMKVNKITSYTSLDAFSRVAKKITNSL